MGCGASHTANDPSLQANVASANGSAPNSPPSPQKNAGSKAGAEQQPEQQSQANSASGAKEDVTTPAADGQVSRSESNATRLSSGPRKSRLLIALPAPKTKTGSSSLEMVSDEHLAETISDLKEKTSYSEEELGNLLKLFNEYKEENGELTIENFNLIQGKVGLNQKADFSIGAASFGVCDLDGSNGIDFCELVQYIYFATQQNQYLFGGHEEDKLFLDFSGGKDAALESEERTQSQQALEQEGHRPDAAGQKVSTAGQAAASADVSGQLVKNLIDDETRNVSIAIRRSDRAADRANRASLVVDNTEFEKTLTELSAKTNYPRDKLLALHALFEKEAAGSAEITKEGFNRINAELHNHLVITNLQFVEDEQSFQLCDADGSDGIDFVELVRFIFFFENSQYS